MMKRILVSGALGASLPLITGAVMPPPESLWWVPLLLSVVTGVGTTGVHLSGRLWSARKRAKASLLRKQEERARAAGDNDKADELELEAGLADAEAQVLDREIDKRESTKPQP